MAGGHFAARSFAWLAGIAAHIQQLIVTIVVEDDFLEPVVHVVFEFDMLASRLAPRSLGAAATSTRFATFARLAARIVTFRVLGSSLSAAALGIATLTVGTPAATAATTSTATPATRLATFVVAAALFIATSGAVFRFPAFRKFDFHPFFAPRLREFVARIRIAFSRRFLITTLAAAVAFQPINIFCRGRLGDSLRLFVG